MRKLAFVAAAILLVGAIAIAVILGTGGDASGPELPANSTQPQEPAPPIQIGPLPGLAAGGRAEAQVAGPVAEFEPEPPPPDPESWEAVPAAPRASGLGRLGPVMVYELNELQPRIAGCFDEVVQSRFGKTPVSRFLESRTPDANGPTLLVLNLELQPGQVRIVDAPVESQGPGSDGLVACVQSILRGHVIRTPVSRSTGRARMVYPLHP